MRQRRSGPANKHIIQTLVFLLLLCATSLNSRAQKSAIESAQLFDYDKAAIDFRVDSTQSRDGILVRDISFAAYDTARRRISAFLVAPEGKGPFAGVLFFHWLGTPKGDRSEFLDDAIALAKEGAISLLIQGVFPWQEAPTAAAADRQQIMDQTVEVRRALDLLIAQSDVDAKRIGFVGHDYGAMFGALAAGVEKRVKGWVLMAALGTFSEWSLKYWPRTAEQGEDLYRFSMTMLDPVEHISRAAPAALLFQFADSDVYISKSEAETFFKRANPPKEIRWYPCSHDLNIDAARDDRMAWLGRMLRLRVEQKARH